MNSSQENEKELKNFSCSTILNPIKNTILPVVKFVIAKWILENLLYELEPFQEFLNNVFNPLFISLILISIISFCKSKFTKGKTALTIDVRYGLLLSFFTALQCFMNIIKILEFLHLSNHSHLKQKKGYGKMISAAAHNFEVLQCYAIVISFTTFVLAATTFLIRKVKFVRRKLLDFDSFIDRKVTGPYRNVIATVIFTTLFLNVAVPEEMTMLFNISSYMPIIFGTLVLAKKYLDEGIEDLSKMDKLETWTNYIYYVLGCFAQTIRFLFRTFKSSIFINYYFRLTVFLIFPDNLEELQEQMGKN